MSVQRTVYGVVSASTTVGATASATINLPRPETLPVPTDTVDFVANPYTRQEFESGRAIITPDSNLGVSTMLLVAVYVMALNPGNSLAPLNLSFSQFPETDYLVQPGFTSTTLRTIFDHTSSPSTSPFNMLVPSYPGVPNPAIDLLKTILLRADEFIQVILYNSTGAPITGVLECRYDFGLNAGNYGSLPLMV
jgi:hypothetical protein